MPRKAKNIEKLIEQNTDTAPTAKHSNKYLFDDAPDDAVTIVAPPLRESPLMTQYNAMKAQHPDALMLFRVGDFYETFGADAVLAANALGITLTKRNNGGGEQELAGFPYHSLDTYLPRLVRAGFRVAICEQLEKPNAQKKIVKRGVTDIITPGVALGDNLLQHGSNNYLAALHFVQKSGAWLFGIAFLDLSTGEFLVSEGDMPYIDKLLQSFSPSEVVMAKRNTKHFVETFGDRYYHYGIDEWVFTTDYTREQLHTHFAVKSLKGFGIDALEQGIVAAGAALHYIASTEKTNVRHITSVARIQPDSYVWLDRFTIRNLELLQSNHDNGTALVQVLDKTVSPMGARLMKKWVAMPLKIRSEIQNRLDTVAFLLQSPELTEEVGRGLRIIGDLERLISKVALKRITPREVVALKRALFALEPIKELLANANSAPLRELADKIAPCAVIRDRIDREVEDEAPVLVSRGGIIRAGVSTELDELRGLITNSQDALLNIQQREAQRTGISSLKVGYTNVFGYYIEITNRYRSSALIPDEWERKQTLANAERYISPELKDLERKILSAEERIGGVEETLWNELLTTLAEYITPIQHNARLLARLDCLFAFSTVAQKYGYCRPDIDDSLDIDIVGGRHPVIERELPEGEPYVPNDILLDNDDRQIYMITGPNMAGKSALLRQTALIVLMAQMGSFVPATTARIGIVDKVFTRVGASDNLSMGESTFMVEMNETASILNNISERSLILLDEIGRGTSTYDGISIAWAIAEYLHNNEGANPKTLFATHYHELNDLATRHRRIHNYHVATREVGQQIIFLRKLVAGGSEHSFGIHVARLAGMPRSVVQRADEILAQLELQHIDSDGNRRNAAEHIATTRTNVYAIADETAERIRTELAHLDPNALSPIDCMLKLAEWKRMITG